MCIKAMWINAMGVSFYITISKEMCCPLTCSHHHIAPAHAPWQFVREFAKLGLTRSVGGVLALALARELTPVVTSIIMAGRVGSAFAAELGTMQARSCWVEGGW